MKNGDGRQRVRGSVRAEFGKSFAPGNAVSELTELAKELGSGRFCPLHLRGVAPMISA